MDHALPRKSEAAHRSGSGLPLLTKPHRKLPEDPSFGRMAILEQEIPLGQTQAQFQDHPPKERELNRRSVREGNEATGDTEMRATSGYSEVPEANKFGRDLLMTELNADCFTDTPARIVLGFDGFKACPAILLPFDLSVKIQKMIEYQRFVSKEQREAQFKLKAIQDLKVRVNREIDLHRINISGRKRCIDEGRVMHVRDEEHIVERLKREMDHLKLVAHDMNSRTEMIERNLTSRHQFLIRYQTAVATYLEKAFVKAEAVEEETNRDDAVAPALDLHEEFQKQVHLTQERHGEPPEDIPLETGEAFMLEEYPQATPKLQARTRAKGRLEVAHMVLEDVQARFQQKREEQENEAYSMKQPITAVKMEAFDLGWVVENRKLTRELLKAEEALSKAKLAAKEARLPVQDSNQSSCFPDDDDDATFRSMSGGGEDQGTALMEVRITAWQGDLALASGLIPDEVETGQVEVDEWGSGNEVGIEDSGSCVAEGKWRRRIDTWERIRPRRASIA